MSAAASSSVASRVTEGLQVAKADVARGWSARHTSIVGLVAAAAAVPIVVGDSVPIRAIASILFYSLAAIGLNAVMGLGNMASIGHGAFVAIGALVTALIRSNTSVPFSLALFLSTAATVVVAYIVGRGAIRLRAVQVAVASWLGAWFVALLLASFPGMSGGAEGIPVPETIVGEGLGLSLRMTPLVHYEVALALLVLGCLAFRSIQIGPVGLTLATIKQNPREAAFIGTLRDDLRLQIFIFGAALAGVAGAFLVQLSGIFDQSAFGVLLSVSLFIAVLLGGPGRVIAPLIGSLAIAVLPLPGQPMQPLFSLTRTGELLPGLLLLTVVALRARRRAVPTIVHSEDVAEYEVRPHKQVTTPPLVARGITKRFGGVVALDDVALEARGGIIHGLIGPNGSGKSTLLSIISGHAFPNAGDVTYGDGDITSLPALSRLRRGISRSPQSTELFPELTALDHMIAAHLVHRRYAGFFRSLFRTPLNRFEERVARAGARRTLKDFGLETYADLPAATMPGGARRTLMIAIAAANKRVVLLDEPSAGMSAEETLRVAEILLRLKKEGIALVVVEHNLRLLGRIADVMTVLDGGRVIAHGPPDHIYEHPEVQLAYLGRRAKDSE